MDILEAYRSIGISVLERKDVAYLIADGNRIIKANEVKGIIMERKETKEGIEMKLTIGEGIKLKEPIHLCFGVSKEKAKQRIDAEIVAEKDSSVHLLAHCLFPNAKKVEHLMDGKVYVKEGAELNYEEVHWHGEEGGAIVVPKMRVVNHGSFRSVFSLLIGRVGKLDVDYLVEGKEKSVTEIFTKVYGKGNDEIRIRESVRLDGKHARSVIKSRIAVKDNARSEVVNVTEGNAPYVRGHVDCTEVVQGNAVAKAIPIVRVNDERAKVTHEAAIGSVDRKQLETLMTRGLKEEEAIDVIIKGMLR